MVIKYETQQEDLKGELGKINKKKKTFDEKIEKAKNDIEKRIEEEEANH
jgi:hypothetical protein